LTSSERSDTKRGKGRPLVSFAASATEVIVTHVATMTRKRRHRTTPVGTN